MRLAVVAPAGKEVQLFCGISQVELHGVDGFGDKFAIGAIGRAGGGGGSGIQNYPAHLHAIGIGVYAGAAGIAVYAVSNFDGAARLALQVGVWRTGDLRAGAGRAVARGQV